MVNLRSRRLETMLGAPLDQLNAQHMRALPENGVAEDVDLDFKRDTYGKAEKSTRELAKDVAAFANAAGGVIVIGVGDDGQGRAASTPGTDITDGEVRRLRQLIATGVVPLPTVDILPIPDPALGQDRGYLLVAVPRSPAAPHTVQKDDGLLYPRRHGTTTYYLSEPEVATAYRNRLQGLTDQQARLDQVDRDAGTPSHPRHRSLGPRQPGPRSSRPPPPQPPDPRRVADRSVWTGRDDRPYRHSVHAGDCWAAMLHRRRRPIHHRRDRGARPPTTAHRRFGRLRPSPA